MEAKNRIILPLDVSDTGRAKEIVAELVPHVGTFKVGLELITAIGAPAAVALVHEAGGKVMLDGKFCDIPNTVAGATRAASALSVDMLTVHASCGQESVKAAVDTCGRSKIVGVTVLTSIDNDECIEIFGDKPSVKVQQFARMLVDVGAHAVVCSPQEVESLAQLPLIRITPGVRPAWASIGDQRRTMTPYDAMLAGADYLVIGRPITQPPSHIGSPAEAARAVATEVTAALLTKAARDITRDR